MSESEKSDLNKEASAAAVEGFEIELRLDATVRVGSGPDAWDFVKPGVTSSVKFSTIPTDRQIRGSMKFMQSEILEPTLEDVLVTIQEKLNNSRSIN